MRPVRLDLDPANVDPDGLADNNSSAGATLTLDGNLTSGGTFTSADGLAHRLEIKDTSTKVQTGATFTITGTDADDKVQVEDRAGPGSGATVETVKYFKTVISVAIGSPVSAATVDMGTVDEVVSQTVVLDHYAALAATVGTLVTGTLSYDVEVTVENPIKRQGGENFNEDIAPFTYTDQSDLAWVNDTVNAAKTASFIGALGVPGLRAMRVVYNSYSSGAELQVWVTQPHGNK